MDSSRIQNKTVQLAFENGVVWTGFYLLACLFALITYHSFFQFRSKFLVCPVQTLHNCSHELLSRIHTTLEGRSVPNASPVTLSISPSLVSRHPHLSGRSVPGYSAFFFKMADGKACSRQKQPRRRPFRPNESKSWLAINCSQCIPTIYFKLIIYFLFNLN